MLFFIAPQFLSRHFGNCSVLLYQNIADLSTPFLDFAYAFSQNFKKRKKQKAMAFFARMWYNRNISARTQGFSCAVPPSICPHKARNKLFQKG